MYKRASQSIIALEKKKSKVKSLQIRIFLLRFFANPLVRVFCQTNARNMSLTICRIYARTNSRTT